MVGDRIYTGLLMAHPRANPISLLFLSRKSMMTATARADPAPHVVVPSLAELGRLLVEARRPVTSP